MGRIAERPYPALTYEPELDGLRAVAVGLVMVHHAGLPWPNEAGVVGVTAFFVLSGYLITRLLVAERESVGSVSLRRFYARRALRLGPALVVVLAFVAVLGLAGAWNQPWVAGELATLLYVANWATTFTDLGAMGHAWSLSIEEQFYLVWPFLLIALSRRMIGVLVIALIAVALWHRTLEFPFSYFPTGAHVDALAIGCAAAVFSWRAPAFVGPLALAVLIVTALLPVDHGPVAIAAALGVVLARPIALRPLAPVGKRAYGLYLWNWPLTLLVGGVVALPLTFLCAELSYRFVERRALAHVPRFRPRAFVQTAMPKL